MLVMGRIAEPVTQGISGIVAGGVQRLAWERSNMIGFLTTAVLGGGGFAAALYSRQGQLLHDIGVGALGAGAGVLGWVGYERAFLITPVPAARSDGRVLAAGQPAGLLSSGAHGRYPSPEEEPGFEGARLSSSVLT